MKKLTMGYITNYSYYTAMVSETVFIILQTLADISDMSLSFSIKPHTKILVIIIVVIINITILIIKAVFINVLTI